MCTVLLWIVVYWFVLYCTVLLQSIDRALKFHGKLNLSPLIVQQSMGATLVPLLRTRKRIRILEFGFVLASHWAVVFKNLFRENASLESRTQNLSKDNASLKNRTQNISHGNSSLDNLTRNQAQGQGATEGQGEGGAMRTEGQEGDGAEVHIRLTIVHMAGLISPGRKDLLQVS